MSKPDDKNEKILDLSMFRTRENVGEEADINSDGEFEELSDEYSEDDYAEDEETFSRDDFTEDEFPDESAINSEFENYAEDVEFDFEDGELSDEVNEFDVTSQETNTSEEDEFAEGGLSGEFAENSEFLEYADGEDYAEESEEGFNENDLPDKPNNSDEALQETSTSEYDKVSGRDEDENLSDEDETSKCDDPEDDTEADEPPEKSNIIMFKPKEEAGKSAKKDLKKKTSDDSFNEALEENDGEDESPKKSLKEKLLAVLACALIVFGVAGLFIAAMYLRGKLEDNNNTSGTPVATEPTGEPEKNPEYAWWYDRDVSEGVSIATDADATATNPGYVKGERILFGTYNQGPLGEVSEISWIVLDVTDEYVLVTSEYLLDMMPYSKDGSVQWEDSGIRKWLSDSFYNQAFSGKEKEQILSFRVINADNPAYNTSGGSDTTDKVFLLSLGEMEQYFGNLEKTCVATPYALEKGGMIGAKRNITYWLRSSGSTDIIGIESGNAAVVDREGHVSYEGSAATYTVVGVRPVIAIKL